MSHLDPLPSDLAALHAKTQASNALNLANVDEIIARLELARQHLVASSGGQTAQPQRLQAGEGAVADTLLPLSSFVKTANAKSAQGFKEWGSAVSKLAKGVDKVRKRLPSSLTEAGELEERLSRSLWTI